MMSCLRCICDSDAQLKKHTNFRDDSGLEEMQKSSSGRFLNNPVNVGHASWVVHLYVQCAAAKTALQNPSR